MTTSSSHSHDSSHVSSNHGFRSGWRHTHVNIISPRTGSDHGRITSNLIFSPSGSRILTLPTGPKSRSNCPPTSSSTYTKIDYPCRPRMRHDVSLADVNVDDDGGGEDDQDPFSLEDEAEENRRLKRINPCGLCKMSYYHGALNYAITAMGIHFLLLIYFLCVTFSTKSYTTSFVTFWNIRLPDEGDGTGAVGEGGVSPNLLHVVHATFALGCMTEVLHFAVGVVLIFGIVKEEPSLCCLWGVLSSIITSVEIAGMTFLAVKITIILFVFIPLAVVIQLFGIWVIVVYAKSLSDPTVCPLCLRLVYPYEKDGHRHDHENQLKVDFSVSSFRLGLPGGSNNSNHKIDLGP